MTEADQHNLLNTVIEDKKEKLDSVIQPTLAKLTARQEAFKRIVDMAKKDMEDYLLAHPERATDQRNKDAELASIQGIKKIFEILDDYEISYRVPGGDHAA